MKNDLAFLPPIYKGAQIIETLRNYAVLNDTSSLRGELGNQVYHIVHDRLFWRDVLQHPGRFWNAPMVFHRGVLSDWTARVPGLYWHGPSRWQRRVPDVHAEREYPKDSRHYTPHGKSRFVAGGLGTFALPPDEHGNQLMTLSTMHNASAGIPILISPDVLEHLKLAPGDVLSIGKLVWRKMTEGWARRFESVKGIPRGYLVIEDPRHVHILHRNAPVEIHPCTVMQYATGAALFFDYVFCTAFTDEARYRADIVAFFERYRTTNGRQGRYLIDADSNEPLFEADYRSPADLLRSAPGGKAQLELLAERVSQACYGDDQVEVLIRKAAAHLKTQEDLQVACIQLGVHFGHIEQTVTATMVAQLVLLCKTEVRLGELADYLSKL